jgi:hypothetical protein
MDIMLVGVGHRWVEQRVGPGECADVFGGEAGGQTLLPVVVAAFDFAFGLEGGGATQHAIEV